MKLTTFFPLVLSGLTLMACQPKQPSQAGGDPAQAVAAEQSVATDSHEGAAKFPAVEVADVNRNPLPLLSEIARHDVTIVDFWASWCGPCRQEAPHLVATYQRYKDRGLGVVGVSLDKEFGAWSAAIGELGLAWPQVSELRGWDDTLAQMLGVNAIPHTIVVSKDGTILARGLRGDELDAFVAKQLDAQK